MNVVLQHILLFHFILVALKIPRESFAASCDSPLHMGDDVLATGDNVLPTQTSLTEVATGDQGLPSTREEAGALQIAARDRHLPGKLLFMCDVTQPRKVYYPVWVVQHVAAGLFVRNI